MHLHSEGGLFKHLNKFKKMFLMFVFCTTLTFSATSQAIDLENPNVCSSGITNMMSDMGLMAYQVADFLNSFCRAIPFFGMFCPDLDQIAGAFFSALLANADLTLDMMVCADQNPSMLSFMLHVMGENPELLDQMSSYLGQIGDGTSKGCQLGDILTAMALRHNNLKSYLFAEMDSYVYANIAKNMQCKSDTAVQLSELIAQNPQELKPNTPFDRTMRNLGTVESDTDGNEVSNERMFQAIFNNIDASNFFLDAVDQLEPEEQLRVLDFVFLGKTIVTDPGCNPYTNNNCPTSEVIHTNQAYFNLYAMLDGFNSGVMSNYIVDPAYPPVPDSEIPANALFARMAPLLMTPTYEVSDYGMSFFGALLTGANIYAWQPGIETLNVLGGVMELGQLPFTFTDLEPLMPVLINPNAPAPRNILDNADCAEDFAACLTPIDCSVMGGFWYDDICNSLQPIQTAHFEGELFYSQRRDFGPFTVDNDGDFTVVLSGTGDIDMYVRRNTYAYEFSYDCKSDNPATSEESCVLYGPADYYISLYGDWDAETSYTLDVSNDPNVNSPPNGTVYGGTGCAIDLPTCFTPNLCTDAGGFWYDSTCNIIPPVQTADFSEQINPGSGKDYGSFTVTHGGNFLVELSGSGDADLYVRKSNLGNTANLTATTETYDCKSAAAGTSVETCELIGDGVYWIYVFNNGATASNIDLKITNDPLYVELTTQLDLFETRLSESGDGRYLVEIFGEGFTDASITETEAYSYSGSLNWYEYQEYGPFDADIGNFSATLTGTGDAELYVDDARNIMPGSPFNLCNSESSTSNESCEVAEPGSYWVLVDAFDDSTYTLNINYPKQSTMVYIISDNHAIMLTENKPVGDIRVEDINGRSVSMAIPADVEPLAFNDNDNDGLHNTLELALGTDPEEEDTDGDGISDLVELSVDGDFTTYTPGVDTDPLFNDNDEDQDGINNEDDPLPNVYNFNDGDLAPLGAPDGQIDVADYLIAIRIQLGEVVMDDVHLAHGDVYPVGAPDGLINMQDALLIKKMVLGQ